MDLNINYADENIFLDHSRRENAPGGGYPEHSHSLSELLLVVKGKATYTCKGTAHRLRPYDLVITRPFDMHELKTEQGPTYERYDILTAETVEGIPASVDVINVGGNEELIHLFEKLDRYAIHLSGEERKQILQGLTREIIVNLRLMINDEAQTPANSIVSGALAYIDANLYTLTGIDELCRELYITKSHLHHLFLEHMNTSPKKYITAKRLVAASREIASGAKPTAIYERYGFTDYSAFYRAYRTLFGKSPSYKGTDTPISMDENTYYTDEH